MENVKLCGLIQTRTDPNLKRSKFSQPILDPNKNSDHAGRPKFDPNPNSPNLTPKFGLGSGSDCRVGSGQVCQVYGIPNRLRQVAVEQMVQSHYVEHLLFFLCSGFPFFFL